ncbi:MAG: hypothetical protein WC026_08315, partial [Hyphomicrobium sp.]|uniref:hypothetical protein n=1 Tax=Hyphomicrobium sp. TaxID=82 RepID=UPI00356AEF3D
FEAGGQQHLLATILAFYKSAHVSLPDGSQEAWTDLAFSHRHRIMQTFPSTDRYHPGSQVRKSALYRSGPWES